MNGTAGLARLAASANMSSPDFDVALFGGTPAGSPPGAYLAMAGLKCVIFERELFPRPHVGESPVPSSTRICRESNFLYPIARCTFPHKYGAV